MIAKILTFNIFIELLVMGSGIYYGLENKNLFVILLSMFLMFFLIILFLFYMIYDDDDIKCKNCKSDWKDDFEFFSGGAENKCGKIFITINFFIMCFVIFVLIKFFKYIGNIGRLIFNHILYITLSLYLIVKIKYGEIDESEKYKFIIVVCGLNLICLFISFPIILIIEIYKKCQGKILSEEKKNNNDKEERMKTNDDSDNINNYNEERIKTDDDSDNIHNDNEERIKTNDDSDNINNNNEEHIRTNYDDDNDNININNKNENQQNIEDNNIELKTIDN